MIKFEKHPKICPFCGGKIEYTSNSVIYGREYGNGKCYLCKSCDAYTGVHNGTNIALGIIANKEMRKLKKKCHEIFDKLWKNNKQRNDLYYRLSKLMNIDRKHCHFGHFDTEELKQALEILKTGALKDDNNRFK